MAETYSAQWTNAFVSSPRGNNYGFGSRKRGFFFTYTQVLAGAANDTILLVKVPPHSQINMLESWFAFDTFTATATLSVGWAAYKDEDGATVSASAAGLLSAILLTNNGSWTHGMLSVATPDDSNPVVPYKICNNREPVTIYATIGVAAPGVGANLSGCLAVYTP